MPIPGSEYMGTWGKKTPVNDDVHITQTNWFARDPFEAHITTNIRGESACVHDRFDGNGNFMGSSFAPRGLPHS